MRILLALLLLGAAPAFAEKACFLSYAGFEEKVPHLDLDACPGGAVKPEDGFCRIALSGAEVLIYEFRHGDPEPCLARVDRYAFNDFVARFGTTYTKP
ncbi:hypothetical protein [Paracraurococcus ruber]|uniref:Uncharacterized protein n=1 Tax=Paracraurococcus ruber TaxID=77675 RepID=A0ABS1CSU7_9PROT|nr:hypothetical protein [Paracraurococcus ruber]MBK1657551.1 hypothetical protein [Paracraurococcus ruber]TDG34104.1 hypothetical protein E2C05_01110 [Paracraurococcus ruber]